MLKLFMSKQGIQAAILVATLGAMLNFTGPSKKSNAPDEASVSRTADEILAEASDSLAKPTNSARSVQVASLSKEGLELVESIIIRDSETLLIEAVSARDSGDITRALSDSMTAISRADSIQDRAEAAGLAIEVVAIASPQERDALETVVPDWTTVESVDGLFAIEYLYMAQALRYEAISREDGVAYWNELHGLCWKMMQADPNHWQQRSAVEGYLTAAGRLDVLAESEKRVLELTAGLDSTFLGWATEAVFTGKEPPASTLTDAASLLTLCTYSIRNALSTYALGQDEAAEHHFQIAREAIAQLAAVEADSGCDYVTFVQLAKEMADRTGEDLIAIPLEAHWPAMNDFARFLAVTWTCTEPAEEMERLGDTENAGILFAEARDLLWDTIQACPDTMEVAIYERYLSSAAKLSDADSGEAAQQLKALLDSRGDTLSTWMGHWALARHWASPDCGLDAARAGRLEYERMVAVLDKGFVQAALADRSLSTPVKGVIECLMGHAYCGSGRPLEGQVHYENALRESPHSADVVETASFSRALAILAQNPPDTNVGLQEIETFLAEHPDGSYKSEALIEKGRLHTIRGEFDQARTAFSTVSQSETRVEIAGLAVERLNELPAIEQAYEAVRATATAYQ
jgi:tetratricopeptide (TPR) repeat protein